jgi:hypothetical protein
MHGSLKAVAAAIRRDCSRTTRGGAHVRYEDETSAMRVVVLRIAVRQAHTGNA